MIDHRPHRFSLILALLALTAATGSALAEDPPAEPRPKAGEESVGEESVGDESAGDESAGQKSAETAAVYENFLRWSTAMEEENFGYDVYRAESEEGPFERLTEKPMLGAGTTDQPSHYEFVDDAVDPYKTYWYYIESVSMTGERERFSPIVRKAPKLEPAPEEGEAGEEEAEGEAGPAEEPTGG